MGLNFYYYDGLQPEIRAGIINEHECTWSRILEISSRNSHFIHATLTTKPTIIFRFYSIPYTPLWLVILCPKQSHSLPCQQWAASAYPLFPPASNFADSDQLGVCMYSFGWTNAAKPFAARIWGQDIKHNWVYFCRVGILWTRTNHYEIYIHVQ